MSELNPPQVPENGEKELPKQGIIMNAYEIPIALRRTIEGFAQTINYCSRHNLISKSQQVPNPDEVK